MDEIVEIIEPEATDYIALTTAIVSAYVANNSIPGAELETLIVSTYAALTGLGKSGGTEAAPARS